MADPARRGSRIAWRRDRRYARVLTQSLVASLALAPTGVACARETRAQSAPEPLLQLEVRDSIGLPLPNASLEVFAYADRGIFREWLPVASSMLPPGIHLLRFSHEGYRPSVFSVPLRKGTRVSLRVQLHPTASTPARKGVVDAIPADAIGLALDGRRATDIVGGRRVIDGDAIDGAEERSVGELLRLAMGTTLLPESAAAGTWRFTTRSARSNGLCEMPVMLNGDPTLTLTFGRFQSLYRTSEPEAIEFVPRGRAVPHTFRRDDMDCPVLLIWLRGR